MPGVIDESSELPVATLGLDHTPMPGCQRVENWPSSRQKVLRHGMLQLHSHSMERLGQLKNGVEIWWNI